jgi:hypothetical protein
MARGLPRRPARGCPWPLPGPRGCRRVGPARPPGIPGMPPRRFCATCATPAHFRSILPSGAHRVEPTAGTRSFPMCRGSSADVTAPIGEAMAAAGSWGYRRIMVRKFTSPHHPAFPGPRHVTRWISKWRLSRCRTASGASCRDGGAAKTTRRYGGRPVRCRAGRCQGGRRRGGWGVAVAVSSRS